MNGARGRRTQRALLIARCGILQAAVDFDGVAVRVRVTLKLARVAAHWAVVDPRLRDPPSRTPIEQKRVLAGRPRPRWRRWRWGAIRSAYRVGARQH